MNEISSSPTLTYAAPQTQSAAKSAPRVALRSAVDISRFYATYAMGAGFPAVTGILLYGWRALAMLQIMLPVAIVAFLIWKKIGARGRQLHIIHTLWLTMLLWMMLPAHVLGGPHTGDVATWPIPICAAILLVMMTWLLGGVGSGRIHPVIVTYLMLVIAFDQLLVPTAVLQRNHLFSGDLAKAATPAPIIAYIKEGYLKTTPVEGADALLLDPAANRLLAFTSGQKRPDRSWLSLDSLLRDELPPLEDVIIGGHPGPIGATCAVAIIIGGLFLLYRGIIDFRVPVCVFIGALVALLTLPIPILIREDGADWRWLVFRAHPILSPLGTRMETIGWAKTITFANYEIMIGPLVLVAFFLATAPVLRPMARRARVIYGLLVGIVAAGMQLYVSISFGPYLALLMVSLLTPLLDRMFRQHPLV